MICRFDSDDPEAPSTARLWVLVEEVRSNGTLRGRLDNEPLHISDLEMDDPIEFKPCHIIDTEHDDNDNLVE